MMSLRAGALLSKHEVCIWVLVVMQLKNRYDTFIWEKLSISIMASYFVIVPTTSLKENASIAGIHYYTVGQSIACPGMKYPYYVAEKDPKTKNILVVSKKRSILQSLIISFVLQDDPQRPQEETS